MVLLDPHPILSQAGGVTLYTHGFFFAVGAIIATVVLVWRTRSLAVRPAHVVEGALWIFLAGLLGARVGFLLSYPSLWSSVSQLWQIWQGGLVSYAGIISALAVSLLITRRLPAHERAAWLDALVLAGLLGWAIGRLGNYYAVESYGVVSTFWSAFYGHVPIQLFETVVCVTLYIFLSLKRFKPGVAAVYGIGGYLAARCIIDFWREETVFLGLHISQWFSLLGLLLLVWYWRRRSV